MTEEKRSIKLPHNLVMEDRKTLMITGVSDVDSFDDQTVVVYTDLGELTVRGSNLHIGKLSVETGELNITGNIFALGYTDDREKRGGILGRLFK
ncbi:MAG: sporulation protein YabP [Oscillospiraceae bacterium]|jgi:sporulation protein YabP|nr:sporulation protein YabP [Oscillospiraceae bacterium]